MLLIKSNIPVMSSVHESCNMKSMTCQIVVNGTSAKAEIDGSLDGKTWINLAKLDVKVNADGYYTDGGIILTSWNFYRANLTETDGLASVYVSVS